MKSVHEYKSVQSLIESAGMSSGVNDVKGTFDWWRKEDDRPIIKLIVRAAEDLAQCEDDLLHQSVNIRRSLTTLEEMLEHGQHITANGVLQRQGVELDMLCQRRQMLIEHLKTLLWSVKEDHKRQMEANR